MIRIQNPVLKTSISNAASQEQQAHPMYAQLSSFEQALLRSTVAPMAFSGLPLMSTRERSVALVAGLMKFEDGLRTRIKQEAGETLLADRRYRLQTQDMSGLTPDVNDIRVSIEIKPGYSGY